MYIYILCIYILCIYIYYVYIYIMYIYILCIYIYYVYIYIMYRYICVFYVYVYIYIYMYTWYIYIYIYIYVYINVYIIYIYIQYYLCILYVCVYICLWTTKIWAAINVVCFFIRAIVGNLVHKLCAWSHFGPCLFQSGYQTHLLGNLTFGAAISAATGDTASHINAWCHTRLISAATFQKKCSDGINNFVSSSC